MPPITYPPTTTQMYQPYREENPCQQCQNACMNECQAAGQPQQQCQQICQQNCQSACGQQPQVYQPYAESNQCNECQNQCHQQCQQQGAQNCDMQCNQQCQSVCQTTVRSKFAGATASSVRTSVPTGLLDLMRSAATSLLPGTNATVVLTDARCSFRFFSPVPTSVRAKLQRAVRAAKSGESVCTGLRDILCYVMRKRRLTSRLANHK
ncbi:hypothetical protein COOONC_25113 [Cooperia oncophora]